MDFPKKQAQRLMPLYLLEYSEKLFTNHPNPEDPWGGGSDYTAGQGITITNNEIAVDTNVIATKSDLPDFTKSYYVNNVIEDGAYFTKINSSGLEYIHGWNPNNISINVENAELENRASIVVQNIGGNIEISDRIDVHDYGSDTVVSVEANKVVINSQHHITSLEDGKLVYDVLGQVREFNLPITYDPRTYTLATTDDIPSLSDYALKTEVPTTATSTSTSTVTPTTETFVTGTSTNTTNVVNSVTYTPSSETLTFTYADNTTASFTFLTSSTTVTSGTTSVVTSVTDSTSNAMTGATVSTSTTTTLS